MLSRPKFKYPVDKNKKGMLYFFKDRAQFDRCVASGCKLISRDNAYDASEISELKLSMELIPSLAIEIWRLEKRIEKEKDIILQHSNKGSISILDQMQRVKDIFKKQEIELREHTGDTYNDGMSVKALQIEEVDNLPKGKMQVTETVKPSVYFKGKVISHGEVIVGKSKEK